MTLKGVYKSVDIYTENGVIVSNLISKYNVVVEDVEKFSFGPNSLLFDFDKILTFADATSLLLLRGGYARYIGYDSNSKKEEYEYMPYDKTIKALKPLEYVSSQIRDYKERFKNNSSIIFNYDLYPNDSKSEMTLYLSANQKKMVFEELVDGYITDMVSFQTTDTSDDLYIYRSTDENFWASGEKEQRNFEFCGITFKKIIKIQ